MKIVETAVRQPVTVTVGVVLILLAGLLSLQRVPIQLTPDVEDTIISVQTSWEGASPLEIEQEIVDQQEEFLQGVANLRRMTSTCQQGQGAIRLEFNVGTDKDDALREVSEKLRQVPSYPDNANEPVVEASDPENQDFIAWFVLESDDPSVDVRTLLDFAEDRLKPRLDNVPGVSESNVLGGRAEEVHIRFDPHLLAQRGITVAEFVQAVRGTNRNVSAGTVNESKRDVRVRLVGQYESVTDVEETVLRATESGNVRVRDVAEVVETFKEARTLVRSRGVPVLALNAQKDVGANVMQVMAGLKRSVERINEEGGVLDSEGRRLRIDGRLTLTQVYDQTVYIDDALALVEDNIFLGGGLALLVLLLFLGSLRGAGIVALAIPVSVIGAVVAMLTLGRTINVISLAGMAFAVGMVVDNAIVVLENIFRHLEMGKSPTRAAIEGTHEVLGAVVAATLTTVVVFIPILLIEEEAGQLFRDIALAIVAAVTLSLVVSITVIPVSAARFLARLRKGDGERRSLFSVISGPFTAIPDLLSRFTYMASGSTTARLTVVVVLTAASVFGTVMLMPPTDYLPQGNRNLIFGLMVPPPGYNLEQREELALRVEETIEPFWVAGRYWKPGDPEPSLPEIKTFDWATMGPGEPVTPPPLANYFFVSVENVMFHGGISADPTRVVDVGTLFNEATRGDVAPGVMAFAFQVPLFRLGGTTGSAVKINFTGEDLGLVSDAALVTLMDLMGKYGPRSVLPDPSNFNVPGPELQVQPDLVRLAESGMSPVDLGQAVQMLGDGAIVGDYRRGGKTIDLRIVTREHREPGALAKLEDAPLSTPAGGVVPLGTLGELRRVNAAVQINQSSRRRSVTLQFTAPSNLPLEAAIADIEAIIESKREAGIIPPEVETSYTGSASKLQAVRTAMLGDGTFFGTAASSLVLALVIVYLLLCVLFQSFLQPLIILFSVPLATLGGFAALYGVHEWSTMDPYMPDQKLDVLTMLGFVILIGVVVNNAILIVHQTMNFLRGEGGEAMGHRRAIAEAVKSRVRPIFMGTFTSLGGMAPLVFMPGSGSELYRGLGSVVIGGLLVSTVFTLLLVPMLLSLVLSLQERLGLLPTGRANDEDDDASSTPSARIAAAMLVMLAVLPGCATPHSDDGLQRTLDSIAERHLSSTDDSAGPVRLEKGTLRLAESVRKRLDELEKMGGAESWDPIDPLLPNGLDGAGPGRRVISLEDAVATAVERNLGVRILRVREHVEGEGVIAQEAAFDLVFFADTSFESLEEPQSVPTLNGVALSADERGRDLATVRTGLRRRLETGATVDVATRLQRSRDNTPGLSLDPDPGYWAGLTLEARQPLLRGSGGEANRSPIDLQRTRELRSREDLHEALLQLVSDVETAYWDLVVSWKLLKVQEEVLRRGEETERVLRERAAFDANPAQWSDAMATVEFRRADRVRMQRRVQAASDRLQLLVNNPEHRLLDGDLLVPRGSFDGEEFSFDASDAVRKAVARRPVVKRAVLDIEDAGLRERVARNEGLPQLDLVLGLAVTGLDDQTLGAFSSAGTDDHYGYSVGLSLEIPLGNRAADARLRQAQLQRDGSYLRYEETVRGVAQDVKISLRDLQASWNLILAARQFRISQTENLRALLLEERQRSTLSPEFLALKLQRQERLATAQAQEIAALGDFHRARARYRRAVGTGLGMERILLEVAGE